MAEELIVFLLAALPVFEVRASVPLGIIVYHLSPLATVILSIAGSVLPALPLLWFLNTFTERLYRIDYFKKFFDWLFARTRSKSNLVQELELIGLILFIAVPLPGTGVWTGTVAAYLFGLGYFKTFIAGFLGTSIAAIAVLLATLGFIKIF